MAYDEQLVERVRSALKGASHVEEKKMIGGLSFMVDGKMCVGVIKDDLMVRVDPTVYAAALKKKGCREMTFSGRRLKGFVLVGPEGMGNKKDLGYWIDLALEFNPRAKASKKK